MNTDQPGLSVRGCVACELAKRLLRFASGAQVAVCAIAFRIEA
jgi:hypothetical protein